MNDIKVNLSYLRLRTLLQARYDLEAIFEPLSDLKAIARKAESDDHLYVPVFHREHHLVTLRVKHAANICDEHKEEILVLTEAILRPPLVQWFERQGTQEPTPPPEEIPHLRLVSEFEANRLRTDFVYVVSHAPTRIRQFASEIHEASEGWALVQWQDIAAQITSIKDLEHMEGVTLFIPDVLDLSPKERTLISAYIAINDGSKKKSLVLMGASNASPEFLSQLDLPEDLKKRIKASSLYLDSIPLPSKNAVEVLRLMLDRSPGVGGMLN